MIWLEIYNTGTDIYKTITMRVLEDVFGLCNKQCSLKNDCYVHLNFLIFYTSAI